MTNSCLFKVGTNASWYVQGGLRFYMKIFINSNAAIEVRVAKWSWARFVQNFHSFCK